MASETKLFLHDHPASSYAQKVRMALRLKGLPFDKKVPDGVGSGHKIPGLSQLLKTVISKSSTPRSFLNTWRRSIQSIRCCPKTPKHEPKPE